MVGPASCWAELPSCPAGAWLVSDGPEGPLSPLCVAGALCEPPSPLVDVDEEGAVCDTGSCEVPVAGEPAEVSCDCDTPA